MTNCVRRATVFLCSYSSKQCIMKQFLDKVFVKSRNNEDLGKFYQPWPMLV